MTPALGTGLCFPTQTDAEPNGTGWGHLLHLNQDRNTDEGPTPHAGRAAAELGEKERAEQGAAAPHGHPTAAARASRETPAFGSEPQNPTVVPCPSPGRKLGGSPQSRETHTGKSATKSHQVSRAARPRNISPLGYCLTSIRKGKYLLSLNA